jgi:hypothetical protein
VRTRDSIALRVTAEQKAAYLVQVLDTQNETYCVQNVGLACSVQPRDGVETLIKAINFYTLGVRLKAVDSHALDEHAGQSKNEDVQYQVIIANTRKRSLHVKSLRKLNTSSGGLATNCVGIREVEALHLLLHQVNNLYGCAPALFLGALEATNAIAAAAQHVTCDVENCFTAAFRKGLWES